MPNNGHPPRRRISVEIRLPPPVIYVNGLWVMTASASLGGAAGVKIVTTPPSRHHDRDMAVLARVCGQFHPTLTSHAHSRLLKMEAAILHDCAKLSKDELAERLGVDVRWAQRLYAEGRVILAHLGALPWAAQDGWVRMTARVIRLEVD